MDCSVQIINGNIIETRSFINSCNEKISFITVKEDSMDQNVHLKNVITLFPYSYTYNNLFLSHYQLNTIIKYIYSYEFPTENILFPQNMKTILINGISSVMSTNLLDYFLNNHKLTLIEDPFELKYNKLIPLCYYNLSNTSNTSEFKLDEDFKEKYDPVNIWYEDPKWLDLNIFKKFPIMQGKIYINPYFIESFDNSHINSFHFTFEFLSFS